MSDPAIKRGKGQDTNTPTDEDGYVQRLIDTVKGWAAPIENTGGQTRADKIDAMVTEQSSNPQN